MPRKLANALTPLEVKNAKAGRHTDGGGLQLLVKPSGARSWVFRYTTNGKSHDLGIGPASGRDAISLADARDEAAALRLKIKRGIDPLDERRQIEAEAVAAQKAKDLSQITFKQFAETYIDQHEHVWKNPKHRQQWRNTLKTYAYPVAGHLSIAEIDTTHIQAILEPIWKSIPETAKRLKGRLEAILDSAKVQGLRQGENPAAWRNHLAHILPPRPKHSKKHHPSLSYKDIPRFIKELQSREAVSALALEFAILTAARTTEVLQAVWDEIDLDDLVWHLPADRMKAHRAHRVPLTPRSIEILKTLKQANSKYVFPSHRGEHLSQMAMLMLVRRMHDDDLDAGRSGFFDPKLKCPATVHGFRATFRDWADEQTNYPNELKEMALAHTIKNQSEAAYRRGDLLEKRRRLMHNWAEHCLSAL